MFSQYLSFLGEKSVFKISFRIANPDVIVDDIMEIFLNVR